MKRIVSLIICTLLFLICTSKVSAEEIKYGNLITDETTIKEDFKLLGLSINDYYKPSYNYSKWYVIAMSESYIDEENYDIQTYFYLYNPTRFGEGSDHMSTVSDFTFTYELKNAEILYKSHGSKLDYDREHLIYKVKGFAYKYSPSVEISITKIQHFNLRGLGITNDSNFKATAKHSKVNGFNVELNFNSTLIIDDIEVVSLQIEPNNNMFKYIFSGELFEDTFKGGVNDSTLQLYFYNFNFPKHIKPDSIEYAYFELKKELWQQKWKRPGDIWKEEYHKVIETKELNYELYPEDFTFDIGNKVEKISFPRFYLGDRYKDKQFGDLSFEKLDAAKFDRDCSIFLDYNYELEYLRYDPRVIGHIQPDLKYRDYSKLKDVELLELWYKKDGITYKCQIVSNPTDSVPVIAEHPKSPWDKIKEIIIKIVDWILNNVFQTDSKAFPEEAKLAIGFVLCVVALIVLPYIIKFLIYLIKLPFKIFK